MWDITLCNQVSVNNGRFTVYSLSNGFEPGDRCEPGTAELYCLVKGAKVKKLLAALMVPAILVMAGPALGDNDSAF